MGSYGTISCLVRKMTFRQGRGHLGLEPDHQEVGRRQMPTVRDSCGSYLNLALNREVEGLIPRWVLRVWNRFGAEMLH